MFSRLLSIALALIGGCLTPQVRTAERVVVVDTAVTRRTMVTTTVTPGKRPAGRGDCRAVMRDEPEFAGSDAVTCAHLRSQSLTWSPYDVLLSDGSSVPAEAARLAVPENRSRKDSRGITVHLIRLRATRPSQHPPLLFLDGAPDTGPTSATIRIAALWPFFDTVRVSRDLILMDYRGSGLSAPLTCPQPSALPADMYASRENALRFFAEQARACRDSARSRGVDLAGYSWAEVAADVEAIRVAVAAPRVDVLGFSSGTHVALATAKRFPRSIRRMTLIGTEGLDHTRKLPLEADRQIVRIAGLIRQDSVLGRQIPDLTTTIRTVLARADVDPIRVRVRNATEDSLTVPVGRFALQYIAAKSLSGPAEFAQLVRLFGSLERGDASMLTALIQRMYARPGAPNGLIQILDGAAGVSAERLARIRREAPTALLSDAANFPYEDIRDAWGYADLGNDYRKAFRSPVPTLFLTGALDGNTPPEQADEVRRTFATSTHLVIERAGHSTAFRMPEVAAIITRFLDGFDVGAERLVAPAFSLRR